jgi:hypothetical protein
LNEIELLQRFRAEVPEPDAGTVLAARSALMERIEAPERSLGLRERPSPRRLVLGVTAVTAAVLAVAVVLSIVVPRGGTSAAAAELQRFAAMAATQPGPAPLGPGEYYYLRQEGWNQFTDVSTKTGAYSVWIPIVREYWLGPDGSGRLVERHVGELIWPGPRDEARWEAQGSRRLYGPSDQRYGPGELVGPELDGGELGTLPSGYSFETLPRDPQALYEAIRIASAERHRLPTGEPTPLGTFSLLSELLSTPLTPPDMRAALLAAMTFVPDIEVDPQKTIPGMGTGAAIFLETSYCCRGEIRVRWEYLVDPATSEFLGFRETLLDRPWWIDADPPMVTRSMAYAPAAVVDCITQRPTFPQTCPSSR